MSDVLTLDEDNILLITGLANLQLIRTAEMADIQAVLLDRGKPASPEMIRLADENGIIFMETPFSIYKASGILYLNVLTEVFSMALELVFEIAGGDFSNAGKASS